MESAKVDVVAPSSNCFAISGSKRGEATRVSFQRTLPFNVECLCDELRGRDPWVIAYDLSVDDHFVGSVQSFRGEHVS